MLTKNEQINLAARFDLHRKLRNSLILRDYATNELYQYFPDELLNCKVAKNAPCNKSTLRVLVAFGLSLVRSPFTPLCNYKSDQMTRYHATCLTCRDRKVRLGKIPRLIRIDMFEAYMWHDRPKSKVKNKLMHVSANIMEACMV